MKSLLSSLFLLLISSFVFAQEQNKTVSTESYQEAEQLLYTNTNHLISRAFVRPTWLPDGRFWYQVITENGYENVLYNPKNKERKIESQLKKMLDNVDSYPTKARGNWNEILSPDGSKGAFIKDWNLYYRDIKSGDEVQLTTDGIENFGYATDNAGWRKSDRPVLFLTLRKFQHLNKIKDM